MKKNTQLVTLVLFSLALSACSGLAPHKQDIQQGNLLSAQDLEQLQIGLRQDQVSYLLGPPLLKPLGKPQQWDYFYQVRQGQELKARQWVRVHFAPAEDQQLRVSQIERLAEQGLTELPDTLPADAREPLAPSQDLPAATGPSSPPSGGGRLPEQRRRF